MKFQPVGPRILVKKQEEAEQVTKSGLFVPGDSKKQTAIGEIMAVGPGTLMQDGTTLPSIFVPNSLCIFTAYAGMPIVIDGETYVILNENDIWGTLVSE